MKLIALFVPALITVSIRNRRKGRESWNWFQYLKEYAIALLVNVFMTQSVITYGLGHQGVDSDAFESFPFFTKYVLIASILAFLFPYIVEVIEKYISVSFRVGKENEK